MEKIKIGTEYFRSGYGCRRPRKATIYLINGFAYAKDKVQAERSYAPLTGELAGYVPVNPIRMGGKVSFGEPSINQHIKYEQNN